MGCSASQVAENAAVVVPEKRVEEEDRDFHSEYLLGLKLGKGAFAQVRTCTKVASSASFYHPEKAVKIVSLRHKEDPEKMSQELKKNIADRGQGLDNSRQACQHCSFV